MHGMLDSAALPGPGRAEVPLRPSFHAGRELRNPITPPLRHRFASGTEIDDIAVQPYIRLVKTTIDLPDELLYRAKVAAAQRKTTLKELVQAGLDWVLRPEAESAHRQAALDRLQKGLRLGGRPLTREQAHERR
jgi:hypothetical protein